MYGSSEIHAYNMGLSFKRFDIVRSRNTSVHKPVCRRGGRALRVYRYRSTIAVLSHVVSHQTSLCVRVCVSAYVRVRERERERERERPDTYVELATARSLHTQASHYVYLQPRRVVYYVYPSLPFIQVISQQLLFHSDYCINLVNLVFTRFV